VLRVAGFHRRSRNTVDWVLATPGAPRWTATDIGIVDTTGVELEVATSISDALDIRCLYGWLDKDEDMAVYASRYVLDYAEHMVKLAATWRATERLRFVATQVLRWQAENPRRTGDDAAALGTLSCFLRPWKTDAVEVAVSVDNMWDDDFEILPGQKVGGSRVSASLALRW
jgi:outer membrane receptor for ferrienterochelin and colicin